MLAMVLVDYQNKVPREVLWRFLKKKKLSKVYVKTMQDMYNKARTSINSVYQFINEVEWFKYKGSVM